MWGVWTLRHIEGGEDRLSVAAGFWCCDCCEEAAEMVRVWEEARRSRRWWLRAPRERAGAAVVEKHSLGSMEIL